MEFNEVVKKRYSCRKYTTKQVEADALSAILEAGRLAPTAKNIQEQRIYVIQSEEGLAKFDKMTPCRYGAPTVAIVCYDKTQIFPYPGGKYDSGAEDATIVATQMILAAADEGVDSCWINYFDPDLLAKELGLPENEVIVMAMDLGYAADDAEAAPKIRKSLDETVKYL